MQFSDILSTQFPALSPFLVTLSTQCRRSYLSTNSQDVLLATVDFCQPSQNIHTPKNAFCVLRRMREWPFIIDVNDEQG